tara:strand:- start:25 stop:936 length:912 start_codon:yes stop_codon:yes gene_type:complete
MNILITGFAGHIGSDLILKLSKLSKIKKIYAIDNFASENFFSIFNMQNKKIHILYEDLHSFNLKKLKNISYTFHFAAKTNAEKSFENKNKIDENLLLTKKIVDFCNFSNSILIFPSSTSVYGSQSKMVDENEPNLSPQSPYADTKIKEENLIFKNAKCKFLIFRLGTIYGYSSGIRFHTAINKFCLQAAMNKPLTVWKKNIHLHRPYLYLDNFNKNMVKIVNGKKIIHNQLYNFLTENFKLSEIIKIFKSLIKIKIIYTDTRLINQNSYLVSCKKINKLGFNLRGNLKNEIKKILSKLDVQKK